MSVLAITYRPDPEGVPEYAGVLSTLAVLPGGVPGVPPPDTRTSESHPEVDRPARTKEHAAARRESRRQLAVCRGRLSARGGGGPAVRTNCPARRRFQVLAGRSPDPSGCSPDPSGCFR